MRTTAVNFSDVGTAHARSLCVS